MRIRINFFQKKIQITSRNIKNRMNEENELTFFRSNCIAYQLRISNFVNFESYRISDVI